MCYYGRIKLTLTRLDHSEEANSAAEYVTIRDKLITWSRKTENLFGCQTTSFFDCYGGDLDPFLASFLQSRRSSFWTTLTDGWQGLVDNASCKNSFLKAPAHEHSADSHTVTLNNVKMYMITLHA